MISDTFGTDHVPPLWGFRSFATNSGAFGPG
jgi:hypothetical protein